MRSFLSFASYYRTFCPNFATVAEPLNQCLRKNVQSVPTEKQLKAFEELKSFLTSAPTLGIFQEEGEIIIDVDANDF